jgi:hypothetical protein
MPHEKPFAVEMLQSIHGFDAAGRHIYIKRFNFEDDAMRFFAGILAQHLPLMLPAIYPDPEQSDPL